VGAIAKSKYADRDTGDFGWYCRDCKANFHSGDAAIIGQELGRVANADPADVENTCLKMAKKRAYVDGTLTTTATSGLFSQDLEDMDPGPRATEPPVTRLAEPAAGLPQHEPGDDRDETPEEVYRRAGVEPPARKATPPAAAGRVPCPHCGKSAGQSKFPKAGKTHYCYGCKHPFDPSGDGE
jgi:hypothetical protein